MLVSKPMLIPCSYTYYYEITSMRKLQMDINARYLPRWAFFTRLAGSFSTYV